jgi:hypothetical protein
VPAERPALDEARPAPLRETNVDDIEVPRYDRLRKDGTRLTRDLGSEVTIGEVRQGEHADVRRARELRDLDGGRVQRLVGSLLFLRGEGRFVDEQVGRVRRCEDHACRPGVPGQHDLPPRPRRAEDLGGLDLAAVRRRDGLARLEAAEERSFRHAERPRRLDVEAARSISLDEPIPVRVHPVLDFEDANAVIAAIELVTRT